MDMNNLGNRFGQISAQPLPPQSHTSSSQDMVVSVFDNVGECVPHTLKEKSRSGECVDLGQLSKAMDKDQTTGSTLQVNSEGELEISRPTKDV